MSGPSVKVPVDWLDSDEAESLGADAVLLMVTALGHSARQMSNGVVSKRILRKLWPVADLEGCVKRLTEAGEAEDRGSDLLFTRWHEFILARSEVEQIRAGNAERQERFRRHQRGDHSMCSRCNAVRNGVSNGVTNTISNGHPTRTDPPRPDLKGGEGVEVDTTGAGAPSFALYEERDQVRRLPQRHAPDEDCCNLPLEHPVHQVS